MQPTTLVVLAVSLLLTGQTYAYHCTNGLAYCGSTLVGRKDYDYSEVQAAYIRETENSGRPPTYAEIPNSLFICDSNGDQLRWINGRKPCGHCIDNGADSDYCA